MKRIFPVILVVFMVALATSRAFAQYDGRVPNGTGEPRSITPAPAAAPAPQAPSANPAPYVPMGADQLPLGDSLKDTQKAAKMVLRGDFVRVGHHHAVTKWPTRMVSTTKDVNVHFSDIPVKVDVNVHQPQPSQDDRQRLIQQFNEAENTNTAPAAPAERGHDMDLGWQIVLGCLIAVFALAVIGAAVCGVLAIIHSFGVRRQEELNRAAAQANAAALIGQLGAYVPAANRVTRISGNVSLNSATIRAEADDRGFPPAPAALPAPQNPPVAAQVQAGVPNPDLIATAAGLNALKAETTLQAPD